MRLWTGSNPGRGKKFFLFPKMSTSALEPTQPPVQWVPLFFLRAGFKVVEA